MRLAFVFFGAVSLLALLAACDVLVDDRLTKLTGAKSRSERVVVCTEVYGEAAVKARILRDTVQSDSGKEAALAMVEEADDKAGKFILMLEEFSSEEFKDASRQFAKRFTKKEFTQLFDEYESVMEAHCDEML